MGHSISIQLTVTKTGISRHIPVKQLYDKSVRKAPRKLININIRQELQTAEDTVITAQFMKKSQSYFVGDFEQNPLQYAYSNMSKLQNAYNNTLFESRATGWRTNTAATQHLGIDITSTIDYHPFPLTFPDKYKTKKSKSATITEKQNIWNLNTHHNYSDLIDSIGNNMPFLTRTLHKNIDQELLIWRDIHPDITAIQNMNTVINRFQPDVIILECPTEPEYLKQYTTRRAKINSIILKYWYIIKGKNKGKTIRPNLIRRFGISNSFAIDTAIIAAIQHKISIVSSDYPGLLNMLLTQGAIALDLYSQIKWIMIGLPFEEFITKYQDLSMPINLKTYFLMKTQPHFHVMCSNRDDMMSLAINESTKKRILFVTGYAHTQGIINRLCGNGCIYNPFKAVHAKTLYLKDLVPNDNKLELNDEDIVYLKDTFTENTVRLFLSNDTELNRELFKTLKSTHDLLSERDKDKLISEWKKRKKSKQKKI